MRISDWSSDVCSSDLTDAARQGGLSALYNPPPPRQASAMIEAPSPNIDARDLPVSMIVLHYTGMETGEAAIARLRSEERRVGKACVSTWRSRWVPYH